MAPPHLVSVDKYLVFHNEAQRAAVHDRNVKTVYDLFTSAPCGLTPTVCHAIPVECTCSRDVCSAS